MDNVYDYSFEEEIIKYEYHYCGYNVKIATVLSKGSKKYYGTANLGNDLRPPILHDQQFCAEKEIEDKIKEKDA